MRHKIITVACWLFLGTVAATFAWYLISTVWTCTVGSCSESDAAAVGSVLGLVLLIGVPWLLRRSRRW